MPARRSKSSVRELAILTVDLNTEYTATNFGAAMKGSGGPGSLPSRGSHRSGRARLTHPAPQKCGFATWA